MKSSWTQSHARLAVPVRALAVLLCALAGAVPAAAQIAPVTHPIADEPNSYLRLLAQAEVRLDRAALRKSCQEALDRYETEWLRIDGEVARILDNRRRDGKETLDAATMKRLVEVAHRGLEVEERLRREHFAAIAAAAPAEDAAAVEVCRELADLEAAISRARGAAWAHGSRAIPDDLGGWLRFDFRARPGGMTQPALLRLSATMASERAETFRALDSATNDALLAAAALAPDAAESALRAAQHPPLDSKAWVRATRAQVEAYRAIAPQLDEDQRALLEKYWMPRLTQSSDAPAGAADTLTSGRKGHVANLTRDLLRTPGLTDQARAAIRAVGRAWVADDRAILERSLDAIVAGRPSTVLAARDARAREALKALSAIPGLEFLSKRTQQKPSADALVGLSEEDAREFGEVEETRAPTPQNAEWNARYNGLPVNFSTGFADDLALLLRLDDQHRAILDIAIADARERWEREVAPLLAEASGASSQRTSLQFQTDEELKQYVDSQVARLTAGARAKTAAHAVDDALISGLAAAFGESVDPNALGVAAGARSIRAFFDAAALQNRSMSPCAVDVLTAVLSAPLDPASRSKALAAAMPFVPAMRAACAELEAARAEFVIETRRSYSILPASNGNEAMMMSRQVSTARVDRANGAWKRLEESSIEQISAVLSPEARALWEVEVGAQRWPRVYPDISLVRQSVAKALMRAPASEQPALRAKCDAILAMLDERVGRLGKASMAIVAAAPAAQPDAPHNGADQEHNSPSNRVESLGYIVKQHTAWAVAELFEVLPPDCGAVLLSSRAYGYLPALAKLVPASPVAPAAATPAAAISPPSTPARQP